jgi:chromosome segregation ATPase
MSADLPPPSSCVYCRSNDSESFFLLQGTYFCGQCGKKAAGTTIARDQPNAATNISNNDSNGPNEANNGVNNAASAATLASPQSPTITFHSPDKSDPAANDSSGQPGPATFNYSAFKSRKKANATAGAAAPANISAVPLNNLDSETNTVTTNENNQISAPVAAIKSSSTAAHPTTSPMRPPAAAAPSTESLSTPAAAKPKPAPTNSNFYGNSSNGYASSNNPTVSAQPAASSSSSIKPAPSAAISAPIVAPKSAAAHDFPAQGSAEYSAVVEKIRRELQANFSSELEILGMDREELEQKLAKVSAEKLEMQRTLEESMFAYQSIVEEFSSRKNDYSAHNNLLEAELQQATKQTAAQNSLISQLRSENSAFKQQLEELHANSTQLRSESDGRAVESDELRKKLEELRQNATNKLKASATEYMQLRQREQEASNLLAEANRELELTLEKNKELSSRLREMENINQRTGSLNSELEQLLKTNKHELITLNAALSTAQASNSELKARAEELGAINQRYTSQLVELREKLRGTELELANKTEAELQVNAVASEFEELFKQNQTLKSQLFDLSQQQGKGGNNNAEVAEMRNALRSKEQENKELMLMVEGLLAQVEASKQEQQTF